MEYTSSPVEHPGTQMRMGVSGDFCLISRGSSNAESQREYDGYGESRAAAELAESKSRVLRHRPVHGVIMTADARSASPILYSTVTDLARFLG